MVPAVSIAASFPTLNLRPANGLLLTVYFCVVKRSSFPVSRMASMKRPTITCEVVKVTQGLGNLPKITLSTVHGSEADVYLFGACITSWKIPSGKDLLFVRPDAVFNGQKPISGGIPHCFPQFGPGAIQQYSFMFSVTLVLKQEMKCCSIIESILDDETGFFLHAVSINYLACIMQHGFARNLEWSVVDSESAGEKPVVTLELKDGPYSRSMWDFSFQALYKITLDSKSLSTELRVTNTDDKPFSFTTALHTYFRASVTGASVSGLKGCKTLNKDPDPKNPLRGKEERDAATFPGFVDCIYLSAPNEIYLENGLGDKILLRNSNWSDTVLWNPHVQMEACYRDFVCVENAKIGEVQLAPNQSWTATQQLSVV
ncbi:putative glucose-6-phosphate 1-epimerase [Drosera capensis]